MTSISFGNARVLADTLPGTRVRDGVAIVGGAALTGLAAQVSIHVPSLTPVPFTLQTLSVLVVGAALGSVRGLLSMAFYLIAGALGTPWFAEHSHGTSTPSFGYIVGFLAAGAVVGHLAGKGNDRSVVSALGTLIVGDALLLAIGTIWLANDLNVPAEKAMQLGVYPFVVGELLKISVAAGVLPLAWKAVDRYLDRG